MISAVPLVSGCGNAAASSRLGRQNPSEPWSGVRAAAIVLSIPVYVAARASPAGRERSTSAMAAITQPFPRSQTIGLPLASVAPT